jgi:hypothetical protein
MIVAESAPDRIVASPNPEPRISVPARSEDCCAHRFADRPPVLASIDEAIDRRKENSMRKLIVLGLFAALAASTLFVLPAAARPPGVNGQIALAGFDPGLGDSVPHTLNPDGSHAHQVLPLALESPHWSPEAGQAAATLTVCPSGCAFNQIAPAISTASPGDTIRVAAGTYNGGFTIDRSLRLVGAGAGSTVISGGGPVVTIGTFGASTEPRVSISGVTITGGVTHSSFLAVFAGDNVIAFGGGIEVPPAADFAEGATVTIANSVITGNRAAPSAAIDSGTACPPDITITCINGDLPFAQAAGGGIDNWGAMTLTNTTVSRNQVGGPVASDADGGGIGSREGSLTLKGSTVTSNRATASAPNGRFAEAGGVFVGSGTLTVDGSLIRDNSASLSAAMPNDVGDFAADGAGVQIGGGGGCDNPSCVHATIRNSTISGNRVTAGNGLGDAVGFGAGIVDIGSLVLSDSLISTNHVTATLPAGSTACACASGAGISTGGVESISDTHITGNTVTVSAPSGSAAACCGGSETGGPNASTIRDSLISGNRITATTSTGSANARGAGVGNPFGATLEIRGTTISDNTGTASGPSGTAQGGGIFTGTFFGDDPGQLQMIDSTITDNALTASPGITIQGGGLFTNGPLTQKDTVIANNVPDQCFGC